MNFQFKPKLDKDYILSKVTQEQIMGYYLGVSNLSSKKLFKSKLRNDHRPTCSLYKNNKGDLIYKDFATGQHLNCFAYVMELFNCDYWQALKIIANDLNIWRDDTITRTKGKIVDKDFRIEEKEFTKIRVEIQDFSDLELKWWAKYGITKDILEAFNVYSCKHVWINDQLVAKSQQHCPVFGYYGKKYQGEELWKIYFPKRKSTRFLGNYPAKKIQGYSQLPKKGKAVVITKSMKDVLAFYACGIAACAPNSETIVPSEALVNDLCSRFNYVFCLWDNDLTGVTFLNKIKKKYPQLHCLIIPRCYGAKDFSDLRAKYGAKETKKLIIEYIKWFKAEQLTTD